LPGKLTFWRRRITAILVVAGIAAALWVALADGTPKRESRADKLSVTELAGQRLVTGFSGGSPPGRVKRMIGQGKLAGVVLFNENLGSKHHARRLIRKLQAQFLRTRDLVRIGRGAVDAPDHRLRPVAWRSAGRKLVETHVF
jgi:hypothetical protein